MSELTQAMQDLPMIYIDILPTRVISKYKS